MPRNASQPPKRLPAAPDCFSSATPVLRSSIDDAWSRSCCAAAHCCCFARDGLLRQRRDAGRARRRGPVPAWFITPSTSSALSPSPYWRDYSSTSRPLLNLLRRLLPAAGQCCWWYWPPWPHIGPVPEHAAGHVSITPTSGTPPPAERPLLSVASLNRAEDRTSTDRWHSPLSGRNGSCGAPTRCPAACAPSSHSPPGLQPPLFLLARAPAYRLPSTCWPELPVRRECPAVRKPWRAPVPGSTPWLFCSPACRIVGTGPVGTGTGCYRSRHHCCLPE